MQRVRINTLTPGQVFKKGLFLASGQKLLGPNTPLTQRHIDVMRLQGATEAIVADSVAELASEGVVSPVEKKLAVGATAEAGVITRTGQLVLEPGEEVEQHHIDAIQAGGGAFAPHDDAAHDSGDGALRRERLMMTDALAEALERELDDAALRVDVSHHVEWIEPVDVAGWPSVRKLTEHRSAAVETLRKLYAKIEAGVDVSTDDFKPIIDDLIERLAKYPSRFTQLALLIPGRSDYLPDHAYSVAVLSMSIGANLKWNKEDVWQVGLASLLYDLGMLLVPQRIRVGASELSDMDRQRVNKHPLFTLSMLQHVADVPAVVKLAAMQHHERENGSGYPRGRRKEQISDYARVLAVADAFAATFQSRHYRKAKLPYVAMEETLRLASAMVFWTPACRALVQSAGLFPVGSYVKLSTGQRAHVIGSNAAQVDRPVIQPLDDSGRPIAAPIDLAQIPKSQLAIVRPIDSTMAHAA